MRLDDLRVRLADLTPEALREKILAMRKARRTEVPKKRSTKKETLIDGEDAIE